MKHLPSTSVNPLLSEAKPGGEDDSWCVVLALISGQASLR